MRLGTKPFRFGLRGIAVVMALSGAAAALLAPLAREYFAPRDPPSEFDELVQMLETIATPSSSGTEELTLQIDP